MYLGFTKTSRVHRLIDTWEKMHLDTRHDLLSCPKTGLLIWNFFVVFGCSEKTSLEKRFYFRANALCDWYSNYIHLSLAPVDALRKITF